MSKLLKENQIRRFMKLASIGNLSESFIGEMADDDMREGRYSDDDMREGRYSEERDELMEEEEGLDDVEGMMDDDDDDMESIVLDVLRTVTDSLESE